MNAVNTNADQRCVIAWHCVASGAQLPPSLSKRLDTVLSLPPSSASVTVASVGPSTLVQSASAAGDKAAGRHCTWTDMGPGNDARTLSRDPLQSVVCVQDLVLVVGASGIVYAQGNLARAGFTDDVVPASVARVPLALPLPCSAVHMVAASPDASHLLFLTRGGEVFAMGSGGALGFEDGKDLNSARLVDTIAEAEGKAAAWTSFQLDLLYIHDYIHGPSFSKTKFCFSILLFDPTAGSFE